MLIEAMMRGDRVNFLINGVLTKPIYSVGNEILCWGVILLPVFAALVNPVCDLLK